MKSDLTIVHPIDPWNQSLGGFDTAIHGLLRHAPIDWEIDVIGLTTDRNQRPTGRWVEGDLEGRRIRCLPVMSDPEPDRIRRLPLSLRFYLANRYHRVHPRSRVVQFHRFESSLGMPISAEQCVAQFLHNHPDEFFSRFSDVRWKRWRRVYWRLLENSLRRSDAVVTVDPRTPEALSARLPHLKGQIRPLPIWVDTHEFAEASWTTRLKERRELRDALGLPESARILVFAGRFELQKNPMALVRMFSQAARSDPDAILLFVGKGRLQNSIEIQARKDDASDRVRILPPVERQRLAAIYRGSDLGVCTSAYEAGPRAVFEALACGIPVVTYSVGQVDQVLESQDGVVMIVAQGDESNFVAALRGALSQPLTREISKRCVDSIGRVTPKHALADLFQLYADWMEQGCRATRARKPESGSRVSLARPAHESGEGDG